MVTIQRLRSEEPDDESAWETLDVMMNHHDESNQQQSSSSSTSATPPSSRVGGGRREKHSSMQHQQPIHHHHQQQQQQQQHELLPQSENSDDDDSYYEPIGEAEERATAPSITPPPPSLDISTSSPPPPPNNNGPPPSDANNNSNSSTVDAVLKESLVDHPMHLFWSRFLFHFMQELWKLDMHIRLALALIILGVIVRLFLWATWFIWNPRICLMTTLLIGPYVYLQRNSLQKRLEQVLGSSCPPPEALLQSALEKIEPAQLRRLLFFILLLPTLLEARTIVFLSSIKLDQAQYGIACWSPVYYNVTVATLLAIGGAYYGGFVQERRLSPRECLQRALLFLYACALFVSLTSLDLWRLPHLLAPFSLSSGVLILAWHDDDDENDTENNDWFSNCVRQALRLTVRDILASITDSVCQDEMLQLAMLRWAVDYWSTTSTSTSSSSSSSSSTPGSQQQQQQPTASSSSTSTASGARESSTQLQWHELGPMLNTTTNQMALEVRSLHQQPPPPSTRPTSTSTPGAYTSESHYSSASAGNNNTTSTTSNPVCDLQSLLASFDLDDRAKPAVVAYKRGVQAFPPERNWAISFAIIHRCPAVLALAWQVYYYGASGWGESLLLPWTVTCSVMLILLPLIALELLRIHTWIGSCQAASSSVNKTDVVGEEDYAACLQRLEPMTILLSSDSYTPRRPPTLLRVWWNVVDSVAALEVGIVTTRCLQTTAVAVEFADNVRSLLQFGAEVQQHGWIHGLAVAFKEVVLYHQQQNPPPATADPSEASSSSSGVTAATHPPTAKYANAAVGALRNSQRMSRNLQILTQEEDVTQLGKPLVSALSVITGYGWLWGRQEGKVDKVTSHVESSEPNPTGEESALSLSYSPPPSTEKARVVAHDASQGDGMTTAESSKLWTANTDGTSPSDVMSAVLQEPSVEKRTASTGTESHDSSSQVGGQRVASTSKVTTQVDNGPVKNNGAPSDSHRTNDMLDFMGNLQDTLNAIDAAPTQDVVSENADDEWEGLDLGSLDITPTNSSEASSINDPPDQCRHPAEQEEKEKVDSDQGKGLILGLAAAAIGIGAAVAIAGQNNGDKEKNDKQQHDRARSNSTS